RDAIGRWPSRSQAGERLVVAHDPEVHLLSGNAARPGARAGVSEPHGERRARVAGAQDWMQRLVDELAVETKIAREHQRHVVVLEPGEPVDDETQRNAIG